MNNSLKKAFSIIETISESSSPMRLIDICKSLNMNKTTAFRYLETLEDVKLVEKTDSYYSLGLKLFKFGNRVQLKNLLIDKIHPYLLSLSKEVEETINLVRFFDGKALYLDKAESNRSLQMRSNIGDSLPLYCTALGKSILSILDDSVLKDVFERLEMKPLTSRTITDKEQLLLEVQKIKGSGYSTEIQEFEKGLVCVAVPLKIPSLNFFGALSISGPLERMKTNYINRLVKKLLETRDKIVINT